MSTAKLNIWITEFADPCHIVGEHVAPNNTSEHWYVHIVDCAGKPLTWCGTTYTFMPAECGHLELDIPPGCYAVFAGHNATPPNAPWGPFGNRLTHIQVVRANCGDHICVTLFSPSMSYCGSWFAHAIGTQVGALGALGVDAKLVRAATRAIQAILDKIELDPFTANLEAFKQEPTRLDPSSDG